MENMHNHRPNLLGACLLLLPSLTITEAFTSLPLHDHIFNLNMCQDHSHHLCFNSHSHIYFCLNTHTHTLQFSHSLQFIRSSQSVSQSFLTRAHPLNSPLRSPPTQTSTMPLVVVWVVGVGRGGQCGVGVVVDVRVGEELHPSLSFPRFCLLQYLPGERKILQIFQKTFS